MASPDYPIRMRATLKDGVLQVKALLTHPMDSGLTKNAAGNPLPANHLVEVIVRLNGEVVVKVDTGAGLAADPLFGWRFGGGKSGDRVTVSWRDNLGLEKSADVLVP
ncbi:MAG: thiosulfate oxidation carrier complex protein SoxZ [Rhodocyclaceae bacterium]|nr:thiosulfate oxidation carrier complex protein SoxZ [Rhodocyclaceae bacterium]